jgi:hypothetical protein
MNKEKFIHMDLQGNPWGIVSIEQMWGNLAVIKFNRPEIRLERSQWWPLFERAKQLALQWGSQVIAVRVRQDYEPILIQNILAELGFLKTAGRIEYQCAVANLPTDEGTPILWQTCADLVWTEPDLAQFVAKITKDALDINPEEKSEDFIQDWLKHDELTHGMKCVSIGFLNSQPIALSVVQIEEGTGWSRISYMGLLPEFRGQGLGKWVHRRGFAQMQFLGGKLYHGGTHVENNSMRKLFDQHGCKVFAEMTEWEYRAND